MLHPLMCAESASGGGKKGRKEEDRGNHFSVFVAPAGLLSLPLSVCQRRGVNDRWDEIDKDSVSEQFSPVSRPRFRSLKDISVSGFLPTKSISSYDLSLPQSKWPTAGTTG